MLNVLHFEKDLRVRVFVWVGVCVCVSSGMAYFGFPSWHLLAAHRFGRTHSRFPRRHFDVLHHHLHTTTHQVFFGVGVRSIDQQPNVTIIICKASALFEAQNVRHSKIDNVIKTNQSPRVGGGRIGLRDIKQKAAMAIATVMAKTSHKYMHIKYK